MSILIIIFGILIILAGIILIVKPDVLFKGLRENSGRLSLYVSAVVMRLILGTLLIYQSSISKFPVATEIIGWIAILAAIVFTLIGHHNFKRLVSWAFSLGKRLGHFGGILALGFGSFLVYAFI